MIDRMRPPFDNRDRRNSGRRRDKDGPRTSRWSKDEGKEDAAAEEAGESSQQEHHMQSEAQVDASESATERGAHTPVHDEPPAAAEPPAAPEQVQVPPAPRDPEPLPDQVASGGATPCHDEPCETPANAEA